MCTTPSSLPSFPSLSASLVSVPFLSPAPSLPVFRCLGAPLDSSAVRSSQPLSSSVPLTSASLTPLPFLPPFNPSSSWPTWDVLVTGGRLRPGSCGEGEGMLWTPGRRGDSCCFPGPGGGGGPGGSVTAERKRMLGCSWWTDCASWVGPDDSPGSGLCLSSGPRNLSPYQASAWLIWLLSSAEALWCLQKHKTQEKTSQRRSESC